MTISLVTPTKIKLITAYFCSKCPAYLGLDSVRRSTNSQPRWLADAFAYTQPVEQIRSTQPSSSVLTLTVDRLQEIVSLVAATNTVSLEVTSHRLTYRAEHPISGANLTVYIAEYLGAIRE